MHCITAIFSGWDGEWKAPQQLHHQVRLNSHRLTLVLSSWTALQPVPCSPEGEWHKVLTYVEYRVVSGVFQNIDPPPPTPPSECVLPPHQKLGVHTRRQCWAAILKTVSFKAIQIHNFWEKNRIKRYNFVGQNFCHRWSDRKNQTKVFLHRWSD